MRGLIAAALLAGPWTFVQGGESSRLTVPHQWNVHDESVRSMLGGRGVYVKRLTLPAGRWVVRFESVSGRARVYLNGRLIGRHAGTFDAFEVPLRGARVGRNRLVVRVDSRRRRGDFPPLSFAADGTPRGGWFNASGILRGVSVRRVSALEQVTVFAEPGDVRVRVRVTRAVPITGTFGDVPFSARGRPGRAVTIPVDVADPRLWSPRDPYLYDVEVRAGDAVWRGEAGVRAVDVRDGRLLLNGRPLRLRGVGYHEDRPGRGMAITDADRRWIVDQAQAVGANALRTHYPPGQHLAALADRRGLLLWLEIPVYQVHSDVLGRPAVRRRAVRLLRRTILAYGSHPSVVTWSLANELRPTVTPGQRAYLRAAVRMAHRLDPGRPVSAAIFGYPSALCQPALRVLDLIGVNEYFGWYPGPHGQTARTSRLSGYLDRLRRCHPDEALVVSEFGAEANRRGPAREKGTYAFQRRFVADHLRILASKRWLGGAFYWALNEFRVRPGWDGGNPRPSPPMHKKGLLTYRHGQRKPAWYEVCQTFSGVRSGTRCGRRSRG